MLPSSDASKQSFENSKFFRWFDSVLVPPLKRFGEAPVMVAIREALPWSLIGLALGLVIFFLLGSGGFGHRMTSALLPGFGCMSIALAVVLPLRLAMALHWSPWRFVPAVALAFALSPPPGSAGNIGAYVRALGSSGLFLAIVLSLCAAAIFQVLARVRFGSWIALCIVVAIAAGLFAAHLSLASAIVTLIRPLGLLGDSYIALLLITVVEMLLWTAGIHGPATLAGIVTPVYITLQLQNTAAFNEHMPLPHIVVVSLFLFLFPGGSGATLPLVALLFFSRVPRLRKIARLTVVPSIFNINEPLIFGLPLVFNPFFALPFVIAPAVLATTTYLAVYLHFVNAPAFYVPSTVPTIISTFLATWDWRACILVVLNVVVAAIIYFPFVRAYERAETARS